MKRSALLVETLLVLALIIATPAARGQAPEIVDLGDQWTDTFDGFTATNNTVLAILPYQNGFVFGGAFTKAGGLEANGIAFYDGTAWSTFGGGFTWDDFLTAQISALAVYDGDLIAGGRFQRADGNNIPSIARWDGTTWQPLGSGIPGVVSPFAVQTLATYGSLLCAGGWFSQAGGTAASNVACWDGSAWSALGDGANNQVHALLADGTDLYAAGSFTSMGGEGPYVARWDGTAWNSVGTTTNNPNRAVRSLTAHDGMIIAGGNFINLGSGGPDADGIAAWDGSTWTPLDEGFSEDINTPIVNVVFSDGVDLYAAGNQQVQVGSNFETRHHLKRWDAVGGTWVPAGPNPNDDVRTFAESGGTFLVGGPFTSFANDTRAHYVARWNQDAWEPYGESLDNTVNGPVEDLLVVGTDLWVGGEFTQAGGQPASRVARWDGTAWSTPSGGPNGTVRSLAWFNNELCVGGSFTEAGGAAANNVACWDGTNWSGLGQGLNSQFDNPSVVNELAVFEGNLIAGGVFNQVDGTPVSNAGNIARWNGTGWSVMGMGQGQEVRAIAVLDPTGQPQDQRLVIGGDFFLFGDFLAGVLAWDGTDWAGLPLAGGTGLTVEDLAGAGNDLVMVGQGAFQDSDNTSTCLAARYNLISQTIHNLAGCILPGPINAVALGPVSEFPPANAKRQSILDYIMFLAGNYDEIEGRAVDGFGALLQTLSAKKFYKWSEGEQALAIITATALLPQFIFTGSRRSPFLQQIAMEFTQNYPAFIRAFLPPGVRLPAKRQLGLDIYVKALRLIDNAQPGFLSPYVQTSLPSVMALVDIVDEDDPDNSTPLFSRDVDWSGAPPNVVSPHSTLIISRSPVSQTDFMVVKDEKLDADNTGSIDYRIAHAALEGGPVDVRVAGTGTILADDLAPGEVTDYQTLEETDIDLEVTSPDGSEVLNLDLKSFSLSTATGLAITFVISDAPASSGKAVQLQDSLSMVALTSDGRVIQPADATSSEDLTELPDEFALNQNYPNPFNPTTTITYALPAGANVTITILDALGRRLRVIESGRQPAGHHSLSVSANDLASGVYFYRLETESFTDTRRMVVLK